MSAVTETPPPLRDQRQADADHLRLLSIFHYVGAGLAAIGLCFLCLHYMFFHAVMSNPDMWKNQRGGGPPPREFFMMFRIFYVVFAAWFVTSGVLNVISAGFLARRKNRTFSLVVSIINFLHIPLGTVLGVFTMVVLLRPSVREVYAA